MNAPRGRDLPADLRNRVEQQWQAWQAAGHNLPSEVAQSLPCVWACSPFVAQHCLRAPALLTGLVDSGDLLRAYPSQTLWQRLLSDQQSAATLPELMRVLRQRRHRELLRIAWRDLAGWASLPETLGELSDLADACVEAALVWLERDFSTRHGVLRGANEEAARLIVLGMGKLGGGELNFSSDIDLILAYDADGVSDGPHPLEHEEYCRRLAQSLVRALSEPTPDGFVYRVDTLLRPFGKSGPLVMHVDAMEQYYQTHGREWERYALIKARPIAGDRAAGDRLLATLRPFVYRRYLDFGAFESLRDMKGLIEQQLHRNGYKDNIKLGAGGIREIEFIAQAFQLIRGGQDRALQQRSLMHTLDVLEREGLLPAYAVRSLREAYIFLRRAENGLQAWQDQQTHDLPADAERRAALAFAMGFPDWPAFLAELDRHRARVHQQFEQVFAAPQARAADEAAVAQIAAIWEETVDDTEALRLLSAQGLSQATATLEFLHQLRRSAVYRGLGEQGRRRFSQLLPLLFGAVRGCEQPETALLRVLQVIEAIAGRTTYLALLVESPMALSQLVALCAASPWITQQIRRHPLLLDELLDPRILYRPAPRAELERELAEAAQALSLDDLESQMDLLRRFKQSWVLRVAAADVSGAMPLMIVSDHLTEIAEIIVQHALRLAWQQMTARHGRPLREDGSAAGFAVIAFGKLGGVELGYGSDLDLVFVHDGIEGQATDGARPLDHGAFFTRLGQKLIHILSAQMPSGVAYAVDMQLRPSGSSGLLVTSLDGYRRYQLEKAWTWEHQALVRARPIAGSATVGGAFDALRREALCQPRAAAKLREEIRAMRQKMYEKLGDHSPGRFDLKHGRGGITDIEFMVQYAVLRDAARRPELVQYTDNIRQIDALYAAGVLSPAEATLLADAYRAYRKRVHALTLQELPAVVDEAEFADYRAGIRQLWRHLLEEGA
jgi:[glutamine synthetase] adenylyltransferase / [glutamine synthetase]-adenylyl-L-tyrosine phosphorylase